VAHRQEAGNYLNQRRRRRKVAVDSAATDVVKRFLQSSKIGGKGWSKSLSHAISGGQDCRHTILQSCNLPYESQDCMGSKIAGSEKDSTTTLSNVVVVAILGKIARLQDFVSAIFDAIFEPFFFPCNRLPRKVHIRCVHRNDLRRRKSYSKPANAVRATVPRK
jgi:hypothetical protein